MAAGVWLWIALWGLAAGALAGVWPGADAWLITSGSMSPSLHPGDLVVTAPPDPTTTYDAPSVITYESDGRVITHRIARVEDGAYVTRGDANRTDDVRPVQPGDVLGVGRVVVKWVGLPVYWWHSGRQALTVLSALSILGAVVAVRHGLPDLVHPEQQEARTVLPRKGGKHRARPQTWTRANGGTLVWTMFLATALSAAAMTASASFAADTTQGATVRAGDFGSDGPLFEDDFADCTTPWRDGPIGGSFACRGGVFTKEGNGAMGGSMAAFTRPVSGFIATAVYHRDPGDPNGSSGGFGVVDADGFGYRVALRLDKGRMRIDRVVDGVRDGGSGWVAIDVDPGAGVALELSYVGGIVSASAGGATVTFADQAPPTSLFTSVWVHGKAGLVVDDVRVEHLVTG